MTDQLDAPEAPPPPAPRPSRTRRELIVIAAFVVALLAVVAVAVTDLTRSGTPTPSPRASSSSSTDPATQRELDRLGAIRALLQRRSAAIVHHDRAEFLSTVDPANRRFRRVEAQMFANLRRVHFASWSYVYPGEPATLPPGVRRRYHAPTLALADFTLQYRIAGFDRNPTDLPQYPTFVRRSGGWYLGSLTDFTRVHEVSSTDLWDYAPVHAIHRKSVLVLGPASELPTMAAVADSMQAAVPKVDAVWGRDWERRVVVLVPATQHEMAKIDADTGDLDQIAALTSSEVATVNGRPSPVGDRVTINPRNWPKLGTLGASIVLTHELTHVATRAETGSQTPKWLSEGFADYIGFLDTDVPVPVIAEELASAVRGGQLTKQLPANRDFRGSNQFLSRAYEAGWMACRYIAERYGQHHLVRFYRAVGTSNAGRQGAVAHALHRVLGLSLGRFTSAWHSYVESQLG